VRLWPYFLGEAWNSLRRKPEFVGSVVITMGLTLGALLSVLTLTYLLWFEPLPYPEQSRLYKVAHITGDTEGSHNADWFTYPGLIDLYKKQDTFSQAALLDYEQEVMTSHPEQPTLFTTYTTPEIFSLLDINMQLGRGFESTESLNTHHPVAVLSYDTWQNKFDGDSDILSQTVTVRGVSFQVVGVLSENFIEPQLYTTGRATGVWLPWDFNAKKRFENLWFGITELAFVGLLKADISRNVAEQRLTPLVNDTWQQNVSSMPFFDGWSTDIKLNSFQRVIAGDSQTTMALTILGIIGLIAIATTNISNLFISRTAQRSYTFSVRVALGAKSNTLYQHLFAEYFLLMGASASIGLMLAAMSFYLLDAHFGELIPRSNELGIDLITLAFALLITLAMSTFFSLFNYKMLHLKTLSERLEKSGKGTSTQVSKIVRQTLIGTQVSIAMILVFVTANLTQQAVAHIESANDLNIQQTIHLHLVSRTSSDLSPEKIASEMRKIRSLLINHPAIVEVTQSESAVSQLGKWAITNLNTNQRYVVSSKSVASNYFSFYDQNLIEGRVFNEQDTSANLSFMVVNQAFANQFAADGNPIGMRFSAIGRPSIQVIGVVEDIRQPGELQTSPTAYALLAHDALEFTIKTVHQRSIERSHILKLLEENGSTYTLFSYESLQTTKNRRLFSQYTTASVALFLALLTIFLAGIGLYGIFSYSTQIRRFEIGTRLAIGAKGKNIVTLVFQENLPTIFVGTCTAVIMLTLAHFIFSKSLYNVLSATLIPISVGTFMVILGLSLWACYWPLRQYINNPIVHSLRSAD
jgi:predicted permease